MPADMGLGVAVQQQDRRTAPGHAHPELHAPGNRDKRNAETFEHVDLPACKTARRDRNVITIHATSPFFVITGLDVQTGNDGCVVYCSNVKITMLELLIYLLLSERILKGISV